MANGIDCKSRLRPAARIRETIREEIIAGKLEPGEQLPPHITLAERFGVSNVTVQSALKQLAEDAFIRIRPRIGSFVAEHPPHLQNIALVFPSAPATSPHKSDWSKYYEALSQAALGVARELNRSLVQFCGVDDHVDGRDRQRLLQHIERHQLGGLIFSNPAWDLDDTPIKEAPGLARAELSAAEHVPWPGLRLNTRRWFTGALDRFAERGRRRVAILFNSLERIGSDLNRHIDRLVDERDMTCPPHWRQAVVWHEPVAANHCVQLLLAGPADSRPDALILADDNLIEGAAAGLMATALKAGEDIDVVAMVNFPLPAEPALPFDLLGYDQSAILRRAVELIDRQRRRQEVPKLTTIDPVWYDDLDPAVRSAAPNGVAARRFQEPTGSPLCL